MPHSVKKRGAGRGEGAYMKNKCKKTKIMQNIYMKKGEKEKDLTCQSDKSRL